MIKHKAISPGALPAIGQPFAGGFYAGRLFFDGLEHALIDAGRQFEVLAQWWDQPGPRLNVRSSKSYFDGMTNTQAMAEAGSSIARKVLGMAIRGHRGWHIPSIEELQVMRTNLLQLGDWGEHWPADGDGGPPQAFALREYWSSTQKPTAGSSWCLHMLPWCVPGTNWSSHRKGIRPVRALPIRHEAFMHSPSTDAPPAEADLRGLANKTAVASVIERFVNEDAGKFYGRTEALVAELAALAGGRV
ncbi:hypothetical protein QL104_07455 [Pseudomonas piscis]|uniref:Uncharacterized protein n=1 Tax=Pseudomonas piscis TaxID=2614538 RepID=A0ABY9NL06_9PSED|nr:hypothetical protein [Pseudomonas piscis]WMN19235.1 hypothetical protein QL104_07455 [Pseudomonas piscis]